MQNAGSYTDGESSTFGGGAVASSGDDSVLGQSRVGFVGEGFAKRFDVGQGESVSIIVNDRAVDLKIQGILPEDPNRVPVPDHLILLDLPGLQSLAQVDTAISRVEFSGSTWCDAGTGQKGCACRDLGLVAGKRLSPRDAD